MNKAYCVNFIYTDNPTYVETIFVDVKLDKNMCAEDIKDAIIYKIVDRNQCNYHDIEIKMVNTLN